MYTLEVVATDRGSPALSTTVTVQVQVMDVNDNSPVFSKSSYAVDVLEDAAEGSRVLEACIGQRRSEMCFVRTSKWHLSVDNSVNHETVFMSRCQLWMLMMPSMENFCIS